MFDQIAQRIPTQTICFEDAPTVQIAIKRLDMVHPRISGNKFFKLKYNFAEALRLGKKCIISFGGAYSNHIAATAYAAHLHGFQSIGIIRGEELAHKALNSTLQTAQQYGMQFQFVSREKYRLKDTADFLHALNLQYPDAYIIPEGGTNTLAIQGCSEILTDFDRQHYDVICCAVGTGGTISGLIEASASHQHILGFSALKGDFLQNDVAQWTEKKNWKIMDDYCCGGYARTSTELLQFMHFFENQYQIPLEQVYTAKILMGLSDLLKKDYFPTATRILVIHTGGLQGRNMPENT
ncbi:pyridoxal-phosphate dependent enzyme [Acinetobacter chinensis]|uniref:Pyridoxal-phosphate dependent enzyme n=1 Tax=Acinetobacter chinensis TaxID=2004650 RepID=A0ABU3WAY0_9GAMM|nr:pyridoxal-phosphate dependent enzyme [Acinetobacter chinensis]MDV2467555.1 pyridoxal-phosphate dependent enzyme [Acinetobacter chinensis]